MWLIFGVFLGSFLPDSLFSMHKVLLTFTFCYAMFTFFYN
jgi:hypothetical protein